jgi:hypothetical protein
LLGLRASFSIVERRGTFMPRIRCGRLMLMGLLSFVLAGCSGGTKITGTVTLNGQPLADARIEFHPRANLNLSVAEARTDAQGNYEIPPRPRGGVGLPPGQYVVLIRKMVDKSGAVPDEKDYGQLQAAGQLSNKVPAQYSDTAFPKITMDVSADTKTLPPIELKGR